MSLQKRNVIGFFVVFKICMWISQKLCHSKVFVLLNSIWVTTTALLPDDLLMDLNNSFQNEEWLQYAT